VFKFDAYFSDIFGILGKTPGGWSNSYGKNHNAGPLCLLELLGSTFNLAKFHPKEEMACITPAWSSGKLGLK